jgi:hypothetical protein
VLLAIATRSSELVRNLNANASAMWIQMLSESRERRQSHTAKHRDPVHNV